MCLKEIRWFLWHVSNMKEFNGLLKPVEILSQIEIRDNMIVADFGCGHGHFSIPLAKMAPNGKIYALDIIKSALEVVKSQAELEKISNIETRHTNLEISGSSKLDNQSVDIVLLRNILFQSEKKEEIIKEADRILKEQGRIVLIEWIPGASLAPKEGWLISNEQAQKLIENQGWTLDTELEMDNQHYGMIFKKF